jgi:hypothetical protein
VLWQRNETARKLTPWHGLVKIHTERVGRTRRQLSARDPNDCNFEESQRGLGACGDEGLRLVAGPGWRSPSPFYAQMHLNYARLLFGPRDKSSPGDSEHTSPGNVEI